MIKIMCIYVSTDVKLFGSIARIVKQANYALDFVVENIIWSTNSKKFLIINTQRNFGSIASIVKQSNYGLEFVVDTILIIYGSQTL